MRSSSAGPALLAVLALTVVSLSGCAAGGAGSARSTELACPSPADPGMGTPTGCVLYDADKAMAQNRAYRIPTPMPPSATAAAAPDVERVRTALAPIAKEANPTDSEVRAALLGLGYASESIQTAELGFGVEADGGCVVGGIRPDGVDVHFAGYIADGGCLALNGH